MIYVFDGAKIVYYEMYQGKLRIALAGSTNYQYPTTMNDGEWHHCVVVMKRDTGITLYVDTVGSSGGAADTDDLAVTDAYIGKYSSSAYWWDGDLDDVRIYNKALTLAEVKSLYNGGRGTESENPTVPAKISVKHNEMLIDPDVENWTGDTPDDWTKTESGGGTIEEESAIVHSGNHCAKFLQVAGGFPRLSQAVSFVAGTTYEIRFWATGVGGGSGYSIAMYGNAGGSISIRGSMFLTNDWVEHKFLYTAVTGANLIMIAPSNSTSYNFYIDDVSIKKAGNIALTNTWDVSDAIVAQYKLNDNLATTNVINEYGTDGTLSTGTTAAISVPGKTHKALEFDASLYIDTNQTFLSTYQDSFTVSAWVKPDETVGNNKMLLGVIENAPPDIHDHVIMWITDDGHLRFIYEADNQLADCRTPEQIFFDGPQTWRFVTFTADSTINGERGLKIYVDGELTAVNTNPPWAGNTTDVVFGDFDISLTTYVGARNGWGELPMEGGIDNFCIFDRVLTAKEIRGLYNSGRGTEKLKDLG